MLVCLVVQQKWGVVGSGSFRQESMCEEVLGFFAHTSGKFKINLPNLATP